MNQHTLSTPPGVVLGHRKNGRPIHPIAGGSEGAVEPPVPPAPPVAEPAPVPAAPAANEPAPVEPAATDPGDSDKTARTIAAIRDDFKGERARRQAVEQQLAATTAAIEADKAERAKRDKALAVALGLAQDEQPPDPVKLAAELQATKEASQAEIARRDAELKAKTVELAILTSAGKHDANGSALLDSRAFVSAVAGLDPAAADFGEQLDAAITKAVAANPQYRTAKAVAPEPPKPPTPARSGGEFNGAPGGNRQWTVEDVQRASASEVVAAQDDGLLMNLGYAPRKNKR